MPPDCERQRRALAAAGREIHGRRDYIETPAPQQGMRRKGGVALLEATGAPREGNANACRGIVKMEESYNFMDVPLEVQGFEEGYAPWFGV